MFILRLIWIIVFLAASSLLPSFPMVECMSVPSATPTDPGDEPVTVRLNGLASDRIGAATTTTLRRRNPVYPNRQAVDTSSSSVVRRRQEDASQSSTSENVDGDDGLTTTIIRKYALHSVCSGRNIHLMGKRLNQVRADAPVKDLYAQLTVRSVRAGEVSISSDLSRRFLCFNRHGKLIMRLEFRDKSCVFHERRSQDHIILQSSQNKTWFVGFGRDGRSMMGNDWAKKLPKNRGCYNFHKVGEKVFAQMGDINTERSPEHHKKMHRLAKNHFKARPASPVLHRPRESLPAPVYRVPALS